MPNIPSKDPATIKFSLKKIVETAGGVTEESLSSAILMDSESMKPMGIILGIHLNTVDPRVKREVDSLLKAIEKVNGVRLTSL